jgi:hypothetical protein
MMRSVHWLTGLLAFVTTTAWAGPRRSLGIVIHGAKGRVSTSQPVKLSAKLNWRGPKATFKYHWTSVSGPTLPYDGDAQSASLVIPAEELIAGETYEVELTVVASFIEPDAEPPEQTAEAKSKLTFDVNAPPAGGSCKMDVTWRGANGASLQLSAPDWSDDHGRVQYRFVVIRNGKSHIAQNWSHVSKYLATTLAKPGDKLQAKCVARDEMGDTGDALSDEVERATP